MMGTLPAGGWHDCFLSSVPRVETRGYSPEPLRGSLFPPVPSYNPDSDAPDNAYSQAEIASSANAVPTCER